MADTFGAIDYLVFLSTLVISVSIGIFFAILDAKKRRNSPDDYFLAGRKSRTLPVALSFVVTFQSSLLILGFPVEVYAYGMIFAYWVVGLVLSYVFASLVVVPVIYPLKITSVYKYLYLRYGDNSVRYLAVFTGVAYSIFYMGSVIFGTCVAGEVILGVPYWVTVLLYTIVTTVYTSIGGIKAVIWTDVFQLAIMTFGIIAVLVKSTLDAGGADNVSKLAHDRLTVDEFSFDPTVRYTVWNISFGTFSMFLYLCLQQSGIQRINSMPNLRSARLVFLLAVPVYATTLLLTCFEGVTIYAYHVSKGCDILEGGVVDAIMEILPFTVTKLFKDIPGISGLFIASLSSAALSTLSSCLSSLSAITYEDVIRVKYPDIDDKKATFLSKITVLIYGLIGMGLTFAIAKLPGSVINIFQGFMGCLDGPVGAIFVLSVLFKRGTNKGVFIGAVCGMVVSFWLIMGQTMTPLPPAPKLPPGPTDECWQYSNVSSLVVNTTTYFNTTVNYNITNEISGSIAEGERNVEDLSILERLYTVSYMLFSLIGFLVTIIVSVLVSYCTKAPDKVDDKYLFSFSKHIMKELLGKEVNSNNKPVYENELETCEEMNKLMSNSSR